jgi:hypothetical protein
LPDERRTEKGFAKTGVPARSKQKSEEEEEEEEEEVSREQKTAQTQK